MSEEIATLQKDLCRARADLARLEDQLRAATATQSEAVSSLHRELRTPLNTVLGFAQLLKASPLGDSEAVDQIFSAAARMAELLEENRPIETLNGNEQNTSKAEPIGSNGSRNVLCIEDNAANSRLIERILAQRPDITLRFAVNGATGLAQAREYRPDLVLLDLNLPDMHGAEVLRSLREDKRTGSVPVVVISADATATQIERLLSNGARNYLTKPIDVARFLHTVDEILGAV